MYTGGCITGSSELVGIETSKKTEEEEKPGGITGSSELVRIETTAISASRPLWATSITGSSELVGIETTAISASRPLWATSITGSSELVGIETFGARPIEINLAFVSPALRSWWGLKLELTTKSG